MVKGEESGVVESALALEREAEIETLKRDLRTANGEIMMLTERLRQADNGVLAENLQKQVRRLSVQLEKATREAAEHEERVEELEREVDTLGLRDDEGEDGDNHEEVVSEAVVSVMRAAKAIREWWAE